MPKNKPVFSEMTDAECAALLARHHIGRLALSHRDRVEIMPIHYVHVDGWLYGRTAAGTKLEIAAHNRWVAFQVDEVEGPFDWRSVVVKGGLYLLRADGSEQERANYERGVQEIRTVNPAAFTKDDTVPERAILFRIHADEVTGRAATTK